MIGVRRSLPLSLAAVAAFVVLSFERSGAQPAAQPGVGSCFLLWELGVGEIRRAPADACRDRVTPASTFKVPHALAGLDAGVLDGPGELMPFDGAVQAPPLARRPHTLGSALQLSVVWYFQRVAERLGAEREAEYLRRFQYGNMDASSGLTTFWIGGSLLISPEEQQDFWVRFYEGRLPVDERASTIVKVLLKQPDGVVVNAVGQHRFAAPWPAGTSVSAKTGSAADRSGRGVRWLTGHVERANRRWIFVSCVIGSRTVEANAAIDLAAASLRDAGVL